MQVINISCSTVHVSPNIRSHQFASLVSSIIVLNVVSVCVRARKHTYMCDYLWSIRGKLLQGLAGEKQRMLQNITAAKQRLVSCDIFARLRHKAFVIRDHHDDCRQSTLWSTEKGHLSYIAYSWKVEYTENEMSNFEYVYL
jgi:hypothetical protein